MSEVISPFLTMLRAYLAGRVESTRSVTGSFPPSWTFPLLRWAAFGQEARPDTERRMETRSRRQY